MGLPSLILGTANLPGVLVGATTATGGTNASYSLAIPAGVVPGDLLISIHYCSNPGHTLPTISGWFPYLSSTSVASGSVCGARRIAASGDPASVTWGPWSGAGTTTAMCLAYRNAKAINATGARADVTSTTTTLPQIIPTASGVLVGFWINESPSATVTAPPDGMSLVASNVGAAAAIRAYELNPSPAGASGDKAQTISASAASTGLLLQLA